MPRNIGFIRLQLLCNSQTVVTIRLYTLVSWYHHFSTQLKLLASTAGREETISGLFELTGIVKTISNSCKLTQEH